MAEPQPVPPETRNEPQATVTLPEGTVTLLGTAHVSRASAAMVRQLLRDGDYDAVAVELCASRYQSLMDPEALARMDLFQVIRQGKAPMVTASLALGAYQQRLAEQFGIEPGAEMRAAVDEAQTRSLPVELIDREVGTTLRRIYRNVGWWRRFYLLSGLLTSVVVSEKVTEEEVEQLKEGDLLESTFAQFAERAPAIYRPLIEERDRYMAARLRQSLAQTPGRHLLAVVGAGHLAGIQRHLQAPDDDPAATLGELDRIPPGKRWLRYLPWLLVALILSGFVLGFLKSPELGWRLLSEWVLINGTLCAVGAAVALAHPLTVIGAFLAAPLTSLNPTIGAGVVTAGLETLLRRPTVGDFGRMRKDASRFRGWWRNRVTRVLLVFVFSTLGSAIGTYLAGFRIIEGLL